MIERKSNWYGIDICTSCENVLSDNQKMDSGGVCFYCGHVSSGTICDTNKVVLMQIKHHPWWRFWSKDVTFVGATDLSKEWLLKN